ncbi:cyclic nucleotide-binding domain protein [Desulfovibrio sp. A2]|nr:cyclic nucleotide-binding domain protein [Desulfovibrio sp. A2]
MHEDVIRFLGGVPPFRFLPRANLRALAFRAQVAFCPAGEELEAVGDDGAPLLHVVVKGTIAVDAGAPEGAEHLGPGAVFGWPAGQGGAGDQIDQIGKVGHIGQSGQAGQTGLTGRAGRAGAEAAQPISTARAATDALCYLLPVQAVSDALDGRPDLRELLAPGFGPALLELGAAALARSGALAWQGGRPWQAVTAGEAMPAGFAAAPVHVSLREAARRMTERHRSAIVLLDDAGRAAGILTDRDFRSRVVAGGADHDLPASALMSAPVLCVQAVAACLDVMLLMAGRNIHHVVVVDGEEPVGVLSSHDLMVLRGVSPTALAERIGAAGTLTELVEAAPRADALAAVLLNEGARPHTLAATLPDLHDRMAARLFELGMAVLGPPPRPWCFLAFGAAARREAWFRHRQWSGLVLGDGPDGSPSVSEHAAAYFGTLARFVRDGLRALGFAPCPQGRMAASPGWTLPASGWRERYRQLAGQECGAGTPQDVPSMSLPVRRGMFDVRPVCGDMELGLRVAAEADAALGDAVRAGAHWPLAAGGADQADGAGTPFGALARTARALTAGQGVQPPETLVRLAAIAELAGAGSPALSDARRACEYLLLRAAHAELAARGAGDGGDDATGAAGDTGDACGTVDAEGGPNMPGMPGGADSLDALALRRARETVRALRAVPGTGGMTPAASAASVGAPSSLVRRGDAP